MGNLVAVLLTLSFIFGNQFEVAEIHLGEMALQIYQPLEKDVLLCVFKLAFCVFVVNVLVDRYLTQKPVESSSENLDLPFVHLILIKVFLKQKHFFAN